MRFGELLIRNDHSEKIIEVKPGDTLNTEDGRVVEVVWDDTYPCRGICALSNEDLYLQGGGYIRCTTFGCLAHGKLVDIHLEVKGGEDDK